MNSVNIYKNILLKIKNEVSFWAENNITDCELLPHQKEVLNDTSNKRVIRAGRRTRKTETIIIDALHKAYTIPNSRITIASPNSAQEKNRLIDSINNSNKLKKEIERIDTRRGYIFLKNGSTIIFITKQLVENMRGVKNDFLYIDEFSYMSEEFTNEILATTAHNKNAKILIIGTPTFSNTRFYDTCISNKFKEFHWPSNLTLTEEIIRPFRELLSNQAYTNEFKAEFA